MSDFRHIGDILAEVVARRKAGMTDEQKQTVEFALDTAQAWSEGKLPLEKARELTSGPERFAAHWMGRGDPRWEALDKLIGPDESKGGIQTKHGFISTAELHEGDARTTIEDGRPIIQFAAGYEKSTGRPYYRSKEQRGPSYRQFRPGAQPKAEPAGGVALDPWAVTTGSPVAAPETKAQLEARLARLEAEIAQARAAMEKSE